MRSRTRTAVVAVLALATAGPMLAQRQQARSSDAIKIAYEHYKLPNGLVVILAPDRSTPQVAVELFFHVGSKNEAAGHTGFAHLFEHVMFTGSLNAPFGVYDRLTEGVGGRNNAGTGGDETLYWQTIPSNYLETALWLESDRMGFLLEKLDSAKFVAQRGVVQNERRERYENRPYGRSDEIITYTIYPTAHPYSWPTAGYMPDLQKASVDDIKSFFRTYYAPGNATLALVGDFEPARAKQLVAKYFGGLPRGKAVPRPSAKPAAITTERRLVFEDRVQVPRLYVSWPTIGVKAEDTYALNALASILGGSRTARLTKGLVYDRQSAATVSVSQSDREDAGEFRIEIGPRAGHTLTELEATTDSILERFKHEGPTAEELERAMAGIEFAFVSSLESNVGKANLLASTAAFFGDPGYYRTQHAKMKGVTTADVKRVANTYLGPGRVVLSIVPQGKTDLAAKADASVKVTFGADGGHYIREAK